MRSVALAWFHRLLGLLPVTASIVLAMTALASAETRVALVLGNAAYTNTPRLPNAARDAQAVAERLNELGFDVVTGVDLTKTEAQARIAEFAKKVRGADIAAFYYAGHAMQANGANYLLPVDVLLEDETAIDFETIQLDLVLRQMSRETRTRLVFIDAGRYNPLADNLKASGVAVESAPAETAAGAKETLVAFAGQPGQIIEDAVGEHSPFTTALLKHLGEPNAPLSKLAEGLRADVSSLTGGKQEPWIVSSLSQDVVLKKVDTAAPLIVGEQAPAAPVASALAPEQQAALEKLRQKIPHLESDSPVFFDIPIQFGDPAIDGKSIATLIQGKPLFSPVEGLDAKIWQNHCSACHQWTKERLCEQAATYDRIDISVLRLEHPLGTRFKVALGKWAKNGCQ